jgi:Fe-S cluster assembly protein SufD
MKTIQITKADQIIELSKSGDYVMELTQPLASVKVQAKFLAIDQEKVIVNVLIHHQAPHTTASVSLKGVAKDSSQIIFQGKILIDENCIDTNSFLEERILLLSDQAKAEAVPELEIKCDDVKCSHAATISRIPDDQLFYLMSRGLNQDLAENILINGFLDFAER